jgi:hypothetical protein
VHHAGLTHLQLPHLPRAAGDALRRGPRLRAAALVDDARSSRHLPRRRRHLRAGPHRRVGGGAARRRRRLRPHRRVPLHELRGLRVDGLPRRQQPAPQRDLSHAARARDAHVVHRRAHARPPLERPGARLHGGRGLRGAGDPAQLEPVRGADVQPRHRGPHTLRRRVRPPPREARAPGGDLPAQGQLGVHRGRGQRARQRGRGVPLRAAHRRPPCVAANDPPGCTPRCSVAGGLGLAGDCVEPARLRAPRPAARPRGVPPHGRRSVSTWASSAAPTRTTAPRVSSTRRTIPGTPAAATTPPRGCSPRRGGAPSPCGSTAPADSRCSGPRRTPASRSSRRCAVARATPPAGRASWCASSGVVRSRRASATAQDLAAQGYARVFRWVETCRRVRRGQGRRASCCRRCATRWARRWRRWRS